MCCITHNKLVLGVTFLSIGLGIFNLITSSYVIHYKEELESHTTHFSHLLACAVFTLVTGMLQTVSSLFFLSRRITTQRWISINAIVFLITILGICIAMSHFQIQPLENSASNSTPVHSSLSMPEFQNSTFTMDNSTKIEDTDYKNTTIADEITGKNTNMSTLNGIDGKNTYSIKRNESEEASMEDSMETSAEENVNPFEAEVEPVPTLDVIPRDNSDYDVNEDSNIFKLLIILRFYFTSLLGNCLSLPIFLGLVASKASKYEVRGKNLLDDN